MTETPRVWPENYWRDVWHDNCPKWTTPPPMLHLNDYIEVEEEDGARLRLFECTVCHQRVYAGLNPKTRRIVHRAARKEAT